MPKKTVICNYCGESDGCDPSCPMEVYLRIRKIGMILTVPNKLKIELDV